MKLYLNFYIFIFLLNFIFISANFIPNGRYFHSSVLVDKKIYFIGGYKFLNSNTISPTTNEFFYLDVSKPFATTDDVSIPWIDLTYTGGPFKEHITACTGGKNNDMIFIFGGFLINQSFVNQFDINKQQWTNITTIGNAPTDNRYDFSCAKFNNELVAIFSGYIMSNPNKVNDLWIFNTLTLTWSLSNSTNAPLPRQGYCAITLPDDNILYIGGSDPTSDFLLMPMDNISVTF
ncbi:galactose oxidase [Gigaspora margarita]|uniref:Galactose oxidase n=1 Tax=Gigaspora margarita TaxID=4874 RepID=A0A8H4B0H9_GIGMA|nr:galactose oxidase [Gigaspora margarita]